MKIEYKIIHRITLIFKDEEIDPRDVDIGFHDESTPKPTPKSTTPTTTHPPEVPTAASDPHKHHNQETNFFAQPGILAGNGKSLSYQRKHNKGMSLGQPIM